MLPLMPLLAITMPVSPATAHIAAEEVAQIAQRVKPVMAVPLVPVAIPALPVPVPNRNGDRNNDSNTEGREPSRSSQSLPVIMPNDLLDGVDALQRTIDAGTKFSTKNYIGIAADLSLGEDNAALTKMINLMVITKFSLFNNVSLRPGIRIADNPAFSLPVTYDFNRLGISPFVGGGLNLLTGDNTGEMDVSTTVRPLVTIGVDVPLSRSITGNATLNTTFGNSTDLRLVTGLAYNF